ESAVLGQKFLLVCLLVLSLGCGKKEALYKEKPAGYWVQALQDPNAQVRREAAVALGSLKAKQAIQDIIRSLKDTDARVRAKAAEGLWGFGPEAKDAVPALAAALKDKSADVRLCAAGALGDIGPEARNTIPALGEALKDRDANVRAAAAT